MIADRIVASIDYSDYLEQQNEWVAGLVRLAQSSEPEKARELAGIIAETLRRSVRLARMHGQTVYLPAGPEHRKLDKFITGDPGQEFTAAPNHLPQQGPATPASSLPYPRLSGMFLQIPGAD